MRSVSGILILVTVLVLYILPICAVPNTPNYGAPPVPPAQPSTAPVSSPCPYTCPVLTGLGKGIVASTINALTGRLLCVYQGSFELCIYNAKSGALYGGESSAHCFNAATLKPNYKKRSALPLRPYLSRTGTHKHEP